MHRTASRAAVDGDGPIARDGGFTILEALVSITLFAILAGASTTVIATAIGTNNTAQDRVTAANLAQADIQRARALQYPSYPAAVPAHVVMVGTKKFTVARTISTTCPALWTPGQPTSMQVTTTVTWPGSPSSVAVATEISC
jgi:type II secretory pathway pseudopilin PulG